MNFKLATSLLALFAAALSVLLLVAGDIYAATYGVAGDDSLRFLARRLAPVLFGLAVILWALRECETPEVVRAVSLGVVVAFLGVAATGVFEYMRGTASWAILVAAASEVVIAVIFARFLSAK